uniref:Bromo domain-containing protein n=1 Tax=Palpitomonas bilix TaxID=652834 RepID=A0A7S3D9E0_9EUKA|mmetsp:Transcript_27553/g.70562  ORF Transcript_27553/g.70562 Transcript_27553/m.70562 type:complete len:365 (+) Transcript_27553:56-1150(+)
MCKKEAFVEMVKIVQKKEKNARRRAISKKRIGRSRLEDEYDAIELSASPRRMKRGLQSTSSPAPRGGKAPQKKRRRVQDDDDDEDGDAGGNKRKSRRRKVNSRRETEESDFHDDDAEEDEDEVKDWEKDFMLEQSRHSRKSAGGRIEGNKSTPGKKQVQKNVSKGSRGSGTMPGEKSKFARAKKKAADKGRAGGRRASTNAMDQQRKSGDHEKAKHPDALSLPVGVTHKDFVKVKMDTMGNKPVDQKSLTAVRSFCLFCIKHMEEKDTDSIFKDPPEEYTPGYKEVISHPMSLHTMKKKVESGEYDSIGLKGILVDMQLMVANCLKFNEGNQVLKPYANKFKQWAETMLTATVRCHYLPYAVGN